MTISLKGLTNQNNSNQYFKTVFACLPQGLILQIFNNLDIKSLIALSQSCKQLKAETDNPLLGKNFFERDFFPIKVHPAMNWKKFYHDFINIKNIPFPGSGATFIADAYDNWTPVHDYLQEAIVRTLTLRTNEKSPISSITLKGHENRFLSLYLHLSEKPSKSFKEYLLKIDPSKYLKFCYFEKTPIGKVISINDLIWQRKFFCLLKTHFSLPAAESNLIERIIFADDWTTVAPYPAESCRTKFVYLVGLASLGITYIVDSKEGEN